MAVRTLHVVRGRLRTAPPEPARLGGPLRHPLAGGVLVASIGAPPSASLVRLAAGWMAAAGARRILLLHVREVPGSLPLGAWPLDPEVMADLRGWVAGLRRQGLRAQLEVADSRSGARTVVDRALAMRARAVLVGRARTRRGGCDARARHVLRRLPGVDVVLFSG